MPPLPPFLTALLAQTFLAPVPPELAAGLVRDGHRVDLPAGSLVSSGGDAPGVALVLDGLLRLFLEGPARQVTVRYARPGEALGLVHLFGGRTAVRAQALTAASVWTVSGERLRERALANGVLATAIAEECAARAADAIDEVALLSFGSVRQRLARHLLDLAVADAGSGEPGRVGDLVRNSSRTRWARCERSSRERFGSSTPRGRPRAPRGAS